VPEEKSWSKVEHFYQPLYFKKAARWIFLLQKKLSNESRSKLQIWYYKDFRSCTGLFIYSEKGGHKNLTKIFIFTWNYLGVSKKDWRFRFIFVTFSENMNLLSLSLTFGHHKLTFCERILCTASIDHACKHPLENWFLDLFFVRLNRLQCANFFSHQKLQ